MSTTPSIRQMRCRSSDGHRKALRAVADGRPALGPTARPSEYRGMRTVFATLRRWECIDSTGGLTERGTALLAELER
jgi:hypothetical protein